MSQSRDEIAEQVVALAGSIGNEKAERMRELVAQARREGAQASDSLVEAADAMRAYFDHGTLTMNRAPDEQNPGEFVWTLTLEFVEGAKEYLDRYDQARARHAEGAKPSGAPAPNVFEAMDAAFKSIKHGHPPKWQPGMPTHDEDGMPFVYMIDGGQIREMQGATAPASALASVEAEFVEVADCLRDRFDLLYRMNGTWNPRDAKETAHDEECLLEYDRVREEIGAYMEPASAQGEVCECGHAKSVHHAHGGGCLGSGFGHGGWCVCGSFRPTPPSSEKTREERK